MQFLRLTQLYYNISILKYKISDIHKRFISVLRFVFFHLSPFLYMKFANDSIIRYDVNMQINKQNTSQINRHKIFNAF